MYPPAGGSRVCACAADNCVPVPLAAESHAKLFIRFNFEFPFAAETDGGYNRRGRTSAGGAVRDKFGRVAVDDVRRDVARLKYGLILQWFSFASYGL